MNSVHKAHLTLATEDRVISEFKSIHVPRWVTRWGGIRIAMLGVIAAALLLFRLGKGALQDWDEAIHAEVSKEIVNGHHWLTLYWQHEPYFRKPPLSFWIRAVFFRSFGVTEFWARFPSALGAIAIVLLTYVIAGRLFGKGAGQLYAGVVLLTTQHFVYVARQGTTDTLLCLSIYLALYAYLRLLEGNSAWYFAIWTAVGIGAMIKGPAVLVAPLAITGDWIFRRQKPVSLNWRMHCLGGLLALAIFVPWHLWMIFQYGWAFLEDYVWYQIVMRATRVLEDSGGGPFFYARVFLDQALPWGVLAIIAAVNSVRRRDRDRLLMWWTAGITVVVYALIRTKHDWYIFPIYPAVAVEVGQFIQELGDRGRTVRMATAAVLTCGLALEAARLAKYQGDPLANEMAQMATMARTSPVAKEPLLIITEPGTVPEIATPTAIFYSARTVTPLETPSDVNRIAARLANGALIEAIIQKSSAFDLSSSFDIHPIAENDAMIYGVITKKDLSRTMATGVSW